MKKIEIIDFLKGYSIFTIVIFHYLINLNLPNPYGKFIYFGGTGVHLFVALSGIGLYLSYLNKPENYFTYLKKRFSKVYIPYVLVVLVTALIAVWYKIFEGSLYALGGHVLLYKMFDEKIIGSYGYPLWFISMIFQFYFVFYIIIRVKKVIKKNSLFIFTCLGISICWSVLVLFTGKESLRVWNSFFLQYLWEFALGMVIASLIYNGFKFEYRIKSIYILLTGIACCAVYGAMVFKMGDTGKLFNDVPALVGYSAIAIWLYLMGNKFVNNFFLFTGKISYSLYLLHSLVFSLTTLLFTTLPMPFVLVVSLVVSYAGSFYYQKLINRIYKFLKI
jgi:peptidoglycan/LPS O-acetylase OafA/YrhL